MRIVCILGRSGTGKFDVEKNLEKLGFHRIVSYTTRAKRDGEIDGEHYNFISKQEFERLISLNAFMEYAEYNGEYYGAPKPIGHLNNIIVVESDGYKQIKELLGEQVTGVYIHTDRDSGSRFLDDTDTDRQKRKLEDDNKFNDILDKVDLIIDNDTDISTQTATILNYALHRNGI